MKGDSSMLLRTAFALLAAAGTVLAVAPAGFAAGATSFTDPQGDASGVADVRVVDVANDDAGRLTIRVTVDAFTVPSDTQIGVFLDTDRNATTGSAGFGGVEYALVGDASDNTFALIRWNGSDWEDVKTTTATAASSSTGIVFRLDRSELGGTPAFDFSVASFSGGNVDLAPDSGRWSYTVQVGAPPQQLPSIAKVLYPAASILPRAGTTFTFRVRGVVLDDGRSGAPAAVTCKATLAGKPIAGGGPGGCTWRLPKSARGKPLVVVATITYAGASTTERMPLKVGG
jgi:hypothetical protein